MSVTKEPILVAMSGGVDSSVAAALLKEAGHEVTGVFLCLGKTGDPNSDTRGCCSPQDAADARIVAQTLGIKLFVLDMSRYFANIIDYFIKEYKNGRTPNPCIKCNAQIKFGKLLDYAKSLGINRIATGHYASIVNYKNCSAIKRKQPREKDQSYVLFNLQKNCLDHICFPLEQIQSKQEVRAIAEKLNLKIHDKPDSQEVCFVPNNDYASYIKMVAPGSDKTGLIVNTQGKILAKHNGISNFTIGQRKGLGISNPTPLYVNTIDNSTGNVIVGSLEEAKGSKLIASSANWHVSMPNEFRATVQVRYNHKGTPALVKQIDSTRFHVEFEEPVFALTPGQAAVCYDGDVLLGGGFIE